MRVVDAALNRAGEGLRVVEDYMRFVCDDPHLARLAKSLRHDLGDAAATLPAAERHAARDTRHDVGTEISTPGELQRTDAWAVCAAGFQRTQQALRSLEEYAKLLDTILAERFQALRYETYSLEKAASTLLDSAQRLADVRLCVLVDGRESESNFRRLVEALVSAGVGAIQLRDKRLDDRELVERARMLVSLTCQQPPAEPGADRGTQRQTLAIINDRPDIAAVVGADGVHLGQEDLSIKDARSIVGTRMLIGVSTHSIQQAQTAILDGANYLGAGPTFASRTKSFKELAGLEYLREVAAETRLPTFAIGGIEAENLPHVLAAGISRVAVGAAITEADDPALAARRLLDILNTRAAQAASPTFS